MLDVFRLVETVCRTNSTILITGESGTGKELVARAIHAQSLRRDHPFVAVNCGALPEALLESELFGHMRGAFTGADANKKGLIEVADKGTIFLDEIGEMSPTMQVKLLRVLQERKYRRVGGTDEVSANIRVIAATNRDLAGHGGRRRTSARICSIVSTSFPSGLPALRERSTTCRSIAEHFLAKYTRGDGQADRRASVRPRSSALKAYPVAGQRPRARERDRAGRGARGHRSRSSRIRWAITFLQWASVGRDSSARKTGDDVIPAGRIQSRTAPAGHRSGTHVERALRQADGVQVRAADLAGSQLPAVSLSGEEIRRAMSQDVPIRPQRQSGI